MAVAPPREVSRRKVWTSATAGTLLPIILSFLSANPTIAAQMRPQGASPQGVSPQGVDVGQIAGTLLPIILSFLSANPTILAQGQAHGSAAVH